MKTRLTIFLTLTFAFNLETRAGSATWSLDPTTDDWNTAANWSPATIPDGPADIATFGVSNAPEVRVSNTPTEVSEIVFSPGASPFTITSTFITNNLTISGAGVTNNSGITQNFATVDEIMNQGGGEIVLKRGARAGTDTVYTIGKDAHFNTGSALTEMYFLDGSSADHASLSVFSSQLVFADGATAEQATITCGQGIYPGGELWFLDNSTAGDATVTVEGASCSDATQGSAFFDGFASAGNATFIIQGGLSGGKPGFASIGANCTAANASFTATGGGTIFFSSQSEGGKATIALANGGRLDLSGQDASKPLTIGSLSGNGFVLLGNKPLSLSIGANNLSTTFGGLITGNGSITKIGRGRLRLPAANTYTGGTTIERGALIIDNITGSGCGPGPVNVTGGTLGGKGTIAGAVTIGTGNGTGAGLAPGSARVPPEPLIIQSSLFFSADSTFRLQMNSNSGGVGGVVASGVTIDPAAVFSATDSGSAALAGGTVFVVMNNTAATPISGVFSNLTDGGTIVIGNNTFQANYEDGDGNDLTLTVVP